LTIKILILSFILLLGASFAGYSQRYHSTSSRAISAYAAGKQEFERLYYDSAENLLKSAITADKKFYEAYMLLGEMLSQLGRYDESALYYGGAVKIDSLFYKPVFFSLANSEMMSGNYAKALTHFKTYLDLKAGSEPNISIAKKKILDCEFAIKAINHPVSFNPVSLGDSINTGDDEYWPSITVDGQTLMFTRQQATKEYRKVGQEDFYLSHRNKTGWSKAYNAGAPLNTPQNEGAQTLSSDGKYMYFTACSRPGGYGRCDIWYSALDGNTWSEPSNIGPHINTEYWEAQPSVSANGKMLFFISNRPGGIGGMDIWYSKSDKSGNWSEAKNIGPTINTKNDEMSPFIHFDGKTLYFSSNGRVGMGGFDIYVTRMNEDSTWSEPADLGYPINTYNDEMGLIIDASGQQAYFSSKRNEKNGKDIFSFLLDESERPNPVSYFRGRVFDSETGKSLKSDYELTQLKSGQIVSSGSTDASGSFLICLPAGYDYGLNVNKPGYLFYSDNFMLEGIHSATEPYNKRILLYPIKVGGKLQLSNVFYEFDSWEIKKESVSELERLYRLLSDNLNISVEIAGYTDSIGTVQYNQTLSERRAKSVVTYLTQKGIKSDRLVYKGYGSNSPIGDNITGEGRKLNRRTEVKVISKK
jgi:tetratricopeptide (TPR) repeat protein